MPQESFNFRYLQADHSVLLPSLARLRVVDEARPRPQFEFEQFAKTLGRPTTHSLLSSEKLLLIINDAYRLTPTVHLLDWLAR